MLLLLSVEQNRYETTMNMNALIQLSFGLVQSLSILTSSLFTLVTFVTLVNLVTLAQDSPEGNGETEPPRCTEVVLRDPVSTNRGDFSRGDFSSQTRDVELDSTAQALLMLKEGIDEMDTLDVHPAWLSLLQHYLVPLAEHSFAPLIVTIAGMGNTGKSTLFNALPTLLNGETHSSNSIPTAATSSGAIPLSAVGFTPGLTKRPIVAVSSQLMPLPDEIPSTWQERLGETVPWKYAEEARYRGSTLIAAVDFLPSTLAFVDSPDVNTGGARTAEPDNQKRALEMWDTSDIIVYVVTPTTINDQNNVRFLRETFQRIGRRNLILVYRIEPQVTIGDVNRQLLWLANQIFDSPTLTGVPHNLIARYLMPHSEQVMRGEAAPQLIPIDNSPSFSSLARAMARNPEQARHLSFEAALDKVIDGAKGLTLHRQRGAADLALFKEGLKVMLRSAASEAIHPFPYNRFRSYVHSAYVKETSGLVRGLKGIARVLARPELVLIDAYHTITGGADEHGNQDGPATVDQATVRVSVTKLVRQITRNTVELSNEQSLKEASTFLNQVERYRAAFNSTGGSSPVGAAGSGSIGGSSSAADSVHEEYPRIKPVRGGGAEVYLGPQEQWPDDLKEALRLLQRLDVNITASELESEISYLRPRFSGAAEREFRTMIAEIQKSRGPLTRMGDVFWPFVSVFFPTLYLFVVESDPTIDWFYTALGEQLLARVLYAIDNRRIDGRIRNAVNEWYIHRQRELIESYFEKVVTARFSHILQDVTPENERAILKVNAALSLLDPSFAPAPVTLTEDTQQNAGKENRKWYQRIFSFRERPSQ